MDVILGGKFENALIHGFDEINRPDRNRTSHQYYIGLNRSVDRSFFDRASTFLVVSSRVLVPTADWSSDPSGDAPGIRGASLDVSIAKTNFNEWDKEVNSFADFLVKNEILSLPSREFVAHVKISDIPIKDYDEFRRKLPKLKHFVSVHYICRLILQLRAAQSLGCYLVLDERDILLCSDIRDFLLAEKPKIGFQLPDIDYKVIMGQNFAGGMLNFSPHDMLSNVAIRADKNIKKYAETVRSYVQNVSSQAAERQLIEGMKETYKDTKTERKIENVYEFLSLAVKPIHYLPVAGNILAAVEDASDVAMRLMDSDKADREWYLLASKATAVSIEDYLRRKANL